MCGQREEVGGGQVARAGFAWASSADRVVANAGGCCSFPSARLGAEGKHARTSEVGLKRPSWTALVSGCLSNRAAKTCCDICRLSVRENLIADTKTRHQAGRVLRLRNQAPFPLFPLWNCTLERSACLRLDRTASSRHCTSDSWKRISVECEYYIHRVEFNKKYILFKICRSCLRWLIQSR